MDRTDPAHVKVPLDQWEAMVARVEQLEARLATEPRPAPTPSPSPMAAVIADGRSEGPALGRRKLLTGLAAAATGAVALSALDSSPAAATATVFTDYVGIQANTNPGILTGCLEVSRSYPGPAIRVGVPAPAGSINPATCGINVLAPNGIISGSIREGIAIEAKGQTGVGVKSTLDSNAPATAMGIHSLVTNAIGMRSQVTGDGTALVVSSDFGKAATFTSDLAQVTLAPKSPDAADPNHGTKPHVPGELFVDGARDLWYCIVAGTPGTWRKLSGSAAAGSFHVLPAPARVYDSRVGTQPVVGSKTKLPAGGSRTLDLTANSSGLPAGAVAAAVTCLLVNTTAGSGNFTIWANGVPKPAANTMVWGGSAGRFSTPATTAVDSAGRCRVSSSLSTDFVLDVVGYYL